MTIATDAPMFHMTVHHYHVMQDEHYQDCDTPLLPTKPKRRSLADTAASKTPPPGHQLPNGISPSLALPGFTLSPYPTPRRCHRLGRLTLGKFELCI